jgi:hypothetical protein
MQAQVRLSLSQLSDRVTGMVVSGLSQSGDAAEVHFTDGSALSIGPTEGGFAAVLHTAEPHGERPAGSGPTPRQREYLEFIKRFMHRFGVAPAETDIQQHFLVSAPSVNRIVRTLERRGFIVRDRD